MEAVSTAAVATSTDNLVPDVLQKMFGADAYRYDLKAGTVVNFADVRTIYLTADLIRGIYEALHLETGDAWKIVMKNCGHVWGQRVAATLRVELRVLSQQDLAHLPVPDYLQLIESYLAEHGWGKASIHLDHAESDGIIRVSLRNSLFEDALSHVPGRVDELLAGMLYGLFENISERELDCIQVQGGRDSASKTCEFLISAPGRVGVLSDLAEQGISLDDAIQHLRSH